ncbi:acyltransferase [Luteimonas kalidii]|uniref:Acyltransferase n=1 Tax=Luteimonas kalidii TaxID=3042025 RepID=A0ABT6JTA3_9GAMM|nr:acyltransferase [Luteimonas kalidii]MDH5833913.1 acyltransferase [Luteimonas kalidii]
MSEPASPVRPSPRQWLAGSPHPLAANLRALRRGLRDFTLPAPRVLVLPYLWLFLGLRALVFGARRLLVAEPLFKAYCTRLGRHVTTGIYVPWIQGKGDLEVGDHVHISGKLSVTFAARFVARPRLRIGARTDIAHDCRIVVGKEVTIGEGVEIAGGVTIRDSGGHPADPARRAAGAPPDEADVKPVAIHDNAWIGSQVLILPGSVIGEGSIISAHSVVAGTVAPYTIVAGNPARRIGTLTPPPDRAHLVTAAPARAPVPAATETPADAAAQSPARSSAA